MAIARVAVFFACGSTEFPVVEAVAEEIGLGVGVAFHEALCGAVGSGHQTFFYGGCHEATLGQSVIGSREGKANSSI